MSLLDKLKNNKGTVSSALGKDLAMEILKGDLILLQEAIPLVCYYPKNKKEKNVRSGAAKIIECVAEKRPELVAPHLEKLLPALEVDEPQTRWMVFRTLGFCSKLRPEIARKAIPFAKQYIGEKMDGQLCLVSSIDLFLGDYGRTSLEAKNEAFPILLESIDNVIMNEHDWLLEALTGIFGYLSEKEKSAIAGFAVEYKDHPRKATRERVRKVLELCIRCAEY